MILWERPFRQELRRWQTPGDVVHAARFVRDGKSLATVGDDGFIRIWGLDGTEQRSHRPGSGASLRALAVSPDGKTVAAGGYACNLNLWNLDTLSEGPSNSPPSEALRSLAFSRDGRLLAGTGNTGQFIVWERGHAPTDVARRRVTRQRGETGRAVAFTGDRDLLVVAYEQSGTVEVWDAWSLVAGAEEMALEGFTFCSALPDANGRLIALTLTKGFVIDLTRLRIERTLDDAPRFVAGALSADGKHLVTQAMESICLWDLDAGRKGPDLSMPLRGPPAVALSPAGDLAVAAGKDGIVRRWRWPGGALLPGTLKQDRCLSVAFSPDGTTLAVGDEAGNVGLWDATFAVQQGTLPNEASTASANAVAFSPDGRTLAVGRGNGAIRLWDIATRQPMYSLPGHTDGIGALAFSPDGRTLASCAEPGDSVRLWHLKTGKELFSLPAGPECLIGCLAFTPDGKALVVGLTRPAPRGREPHRQECFLRMYRAASDGE